MKETKPIENARTVARSPKARRFELLRKQPAAQQNGASTHVVQATSCADTEKTRSVKCTKLSRILTHYH